MTSYKSRADLLIAAGESIKMQEAAGCGPVLKVNGREYMIAECGCYEGNDYEFPLAVVEGKAVFVGDELWCLIGYARKIEVEECRNGYIVATDGGKFNLKNTDGLISWLPTKPKTLMVELSLADVNFWASFGVLLTAQNHNTRLFDACRRALEQSK